MERYEHDGYTYLVPLLPSGSDSDSGFGESDSAEERSRRLLWTVRAIRDRGGAAEGIESFGCDVSGGGGALGGEGPSWSSRLSALQRRFLPHAPLALERAKIRADEAWERAWDDAFLGRDGASWGEETSAMGRGKGRSEGEESCESDFDGAGGGGIAIALVEARVLDRSGRVVAVVEPTDSPSIDGGKDEEGKEAMDGGAKAYREGVLRRAWYLQFELCVKIDAGGGFGDEGAGELDDCLLTSDMVQSREEPNMLYDEGAEEPATAGPGWHHLTAAVRLPRRFSSAAVEWCCLSDAALLLSSQTRFGHHRHRRSPLDCLMSVAPSVDPSGFAYSNPAPLRRFLSHLRSYHILPLLTNEIASDYVGPYGTMDPALLLSTLRMDPIKLEDPKSMQLRALERYHMRFGLTVRLFNFHREYPADLAECFFAGLDEVLVDTHHLGEYNVQRGGAGKGGGGDGVVCAGSAEGGLADGEEEAPSNARQLEAIRDLHRRAIEAIEWIDEAKGGSVSKGGASVGAVGSDEEGEGETRTFGVASAKARWWG